ncbi:MAG: protein kinase domain-containing protein, partial [Archangium sp.]
MTHVEENRLLAFTVGQLSVDDAADVEAHLRECEACRHRQENLSSSAFSKTVEGSGGTPTRVDGSTSGNGHTLERGVELGHYVLLEKLGSGGMGEVFAAYDPRLDRKVALKLLRSGALSVQEGRARLLREAQAMARLQHPNVIAVHDVGVIGERVFVAMEYVEGETLAEWLRGRREWDEIVRIFLAAGSGLAAAHKAGLVHRDFKPDNVLLGSDLRPRVVDFGLARQSNATPAPSLPEIVAQSGATSLSHKLTRDGAVMGTPGYMPPEQINGLATDARSDQFSFCVALWGALYGSRPFSGTTLSQIAKEIAQGHFTAVPSDSQVPEYVHDAMMRGLNNNPADRWPDMDSLLRALRLRARANPRRRLFVAGLVCFSLLGIGYGLWTRQRTMVCAGMERELQGTWDPARKEKLRDAFVSTGLSYAGDAWSRTEHAIDAWAAEWVVASREVCEASKLREEDSAELTELKTACLDERRQQLKALVSIFEAPDHDVVNTAPTAAHELEGAAACISATRLKSRPATDEKERAAEAALRTKIVEARAQLAAGKYPAGLQRLQDISPSAAPAMQAEADLLLERLYL